MDIMTILICIGTGLLLLVGFTIFTCILFGILACISDDDKPTWVGVLMLGTILMALAVALGCLAAFEFGWIADCPWCEVKP